MRDIPIGVLIVSWYLWLGKSYLDYRQYRVCKKTNEVPSELRDIINDDAFRSNKAHSIVKSQFNFLWSLYNQLQFTLVLGCELMPFLWKLSGDIVTKMFGPNQLDSFQCEICQTRVYLLITILAWTLVNLPVYMCNAFFIDRKLGSKEQTAGLYILATIRKILTVYFTLVLLASPIIYLYSGPNYPSFVYEWLICALLMIYWTFFHGQVRALLNNITPLPAGELRNKIEALAKELSFPLSSISVVENPRIGAHLNAYLTGIFGRKGIVIDSALIKDFNEERDNLAELDKNQAKIGASSTFFSPDKPIKKKSLSHNEILAVLCHEIGHWHSDHRIKSLVLLEIKYMYFFCLVSGLREFRNLYPGLGFDQDKPVIVTFALVVIVLAFFNGILRFFTTVMTRIFEFGADNYAKKQGHAENLKAALLKLNAEDSEFPVYDMVYSRFNHPRPPLIQRIKALNEVSVA